jgi:hypothetical protein
MILSWIMQLPAEILRARPQLCQLFAGGMMRTEGCPANERWQQTCETSGPYGDAIMTFHKIIRTSTMWVLQ